METFIHPFNVKAWLLATLLEKVDDQAMTVGDLRINLGKFGRTAKAMPSIEQINSEQG